MRPAFSVLALAAALVCAAPAFAHWEYTRWGMSPAEVIAASSGAVRPAEGGYGEQVFDLDLRAQGIYRAGGMDFEVRFFFTPGENRLTAVKLIPAASRCDDLARQLRAAHGEGERSNLQIGHVMHWADPANGDSVLYADIGPIGRMARICHVIYQPLAPAREGEAAEPPGQ
jgi:hypothetical protein